MATLKNIQWSTWHTLLILQCSCPHHQINTGWDSLKLPRQRSCRIFCFLLKFCLHCCENLFADIISSACHTCRNTWNKKIKDFSLRLLSCANSCQSLHKSPRLTDSLFILLIYFFCQSVPIHSSVCLSNCSIIHLSFCLSVCLSTPLSISLSGYSSTINGVDNVNWPP